MDLLDLSEETLLQRPLSRRFPRTLRRSEGRVGSPLFTS
jgi:hypothetical protein